MDLHNGLDTEVYDLHPTDLHHHHHHHYYYYYYMHVTIRMALRTVHTDPAKLLLLNNAR